ncbi:U-box domain-containing protein 70-like [Cornus florida]|uniref:U-box domain-containing protein 70-like n=1 Tax=Cornus florida TaxID=4283 RepID=UPI00289D82E4|nr:U-box domain-containing protein 70-like [Cornus florida]
MKMAESAASLKDQGNEFFKSGNYLKAASLYTQALKKDPCNPLLYSNRAAAFLHLVELNKALADAETTITLKPFWEKGYFRKGCILEAMEQYDDALAAFERALQHNPQISEVPEKIKRLSQLARDKKRAQEVENMRSNVDMTKHLDILKSELSENYGAEECWKIFFSFLVETMEAAVKSWHETSKVNARVYFLLDKKRTDTDKYAPVTKIDKAFSSPHMHKDHYFLLREYAEESSSRAACVVAPKSMISYPQIWNGEGSRKWHGQNDGFFVQFESPPLRKLWFFPSSTYKGQMLCRDPVVLDITDYELFPRLLKQTYSRQ